MHTVLFFKLAIKKNVENRLNTNRTLITKMSTALEKNETLLWFVDKKIQKLQEKLEMSKIEMTLQIIF